MINAMEVNVTCLKSFRYIELGDLNEIEMLKVVKFHHFQTRIDGGINLNRRHM